MNITDYMYENVIMYVSPDQAEHTGTVAVSNTVFGNVGTAVLMFYRCCYGGYCSVYRGFEANFELRRKWTRRMCRSGRHECLCRKARHNNVVQDVCGQF